MRRSVPLRVRTLVTLAGIGLAAAASAATQPKMVLQAAQGPGWTPVLRARFHSLDQGSRLIPLAWLKELKEQDGTPFLADGLARHSYLPEPSPDNPDGLPLGFSVAASPDGPIAGLTCAACHTRELKVDGQAWRIEGGPAFADFQGFLADLDGSVLRVLASDAAFDPFARGVLGADFAKPAAVENLRAAVALWSLRFHTWLRALPDSPWGPARLDAFSMIFNRLAVLDLGAPPSYVIADNVAMANAPARYPFIWNSPLQDRTDWAGFADNGNDKFALARNLGEVLGVFAVFHPKPTPAGAPLNRDYLGDNSANFAGLAALEGMVLALKPPTWPWPVDKALAEKGHAVFDLPKDKGGCVDCHGIAPGAIRGPRATFRTPVLDVGTDTRMWDILRRPAKTGSFAGALIPGVTAPLRETDAVANILKTAVIGTLAAVDARQAGASAKPVAMQAMAGAVRMPAHAGMNAAEKNEAPTIDAYEARVLEGIWAAAPYLHNGSVPTLADLLKPQAERTKRFKVGSAYDIATVGLAVEQPESDFTLVTTGCEARGSGNSNCGHDFGTHLPDGQKRALLEYLKTL